MMQRHPSVTKLIQSALEEDLPAGDITSELTIPAEMKASASLIAREQLVFCGGALIERIFELAGCPADIIIHTQDGEQAAAGRELAVLEGTALHLLALERTILNFLQRLSGIATMTRKWTEAAPGLMLLDTRKTTPGWRVLEKYAVKTGGGGNHRMSLSDMILVKNNHADLLGKGLADTIIKALAVKPRYLPVEVEVRNLTELAEVINLEIDAVMLDNMSDEEISRALAVINKQAPRLKVEVSGGLTLPRLKSLYALGVRCASCGALTNRAVSVDISLGIVGRFHTLST